MVTLGLADCNPLVLIAKHWIDHEINRVIASFYIDKFDKYNYS